MEKLRPCPFCGNQVRINYDANLEPAGIWCGTCRMLVKYTRIRVEKGERYGACIDKLTEAWNRRCGG